MLTCLPVYKLLSLFLVCSLRIYINEMLLGCVDIQLQVNPQILSAAGHSGTVDVLLFTQFGVHRDFRCIRVLNSAFVNCARCTLGFWFLKKYAHQNDPLNQGNLHELKLRLKIVRYPGIEVVPYYQTNKNYLVPAPWVVFLLTTQPLTDVLS